MCGTPVFLAHRTIQMGSNPLGETVLLHVGLVYVHAYTHIHTHDEHKLRVGIYIIGAEHKLCVGIYMYIIGKGIYLRVVWVVFVCFTYNNLRSHPEGRMYTVHIQMRNVILTTEWGSVLSCVHLHEYT